MYPIKIDSIETFDYSGDVYNLHLKSKDKKDDLYWIDAKSRLISHNCFPKDVNALLKISSNISEESKILKAVSESNESRPKRFVDTMFSYLLPDKVAIWGLAFKPETDDIRDAASIKVIKLLLDHGIQVNVHDPMALENTQKVFGDKINYFESQYECLLKVDALLLCTEWGIYRMPNWGLMKKLMFQHFIFDGRNQYNVKEVRDQGFNYISIGREAGII